MFRNQYDTDVTTFSPAGRLHQVEYAMEAVQQGSCSVGLRTSQWAVVASLKRSSSELASYQQKVFKVDQHIGIAISGLISDARVLGQLRTHSSDAPTATHLTAPSTDSSPSPPPLRCCVCVSVCGAVCVQLSTCAMSV